MKNLTPYQISKLEKKLYLSKDSIDFEFTRWTKNGHDRIYFKRRSGRFVDEYGYLDMQTGEVMPKKSSFAIELEAIITSLAPEDTPSFLPHTYIFDRLKYAEKYNLGLSQGYITIARDGDNAKIIHTYGSKVDIAIVYPSGEIEYLGNHAQEKQLVSIAMPKNINLPISFDKFTLNERIPTEYWYNTGERSKLNDGTIMGEIKYIVHVNDLARILSGELKIEDFTDSFDGKRNNIYLTRSNYSNFVHFSERVHINANR